VKPYRGKFQGEYPIQKATSALERDLMDAIKDLKDNFGLFPTAADRVVFEPRDTSECAFKGPYGIEAGAAGGPMRVDIPMEPLVLGWYPARRVMAAALAEAVLTREAPGYASAPPWLRHGLALHLSRFGEFVERRYLLQSADSPLHKVRALEEAGDDSWTAGYWALRSLAGRRGDAGVKALADALRQKADWREALRSAGETPEQMDSTYRTWAKAHLRDITANREEFLDMVGLLRREREKEVLPRFEAFTREHPLDLYAGDSRYYHAYALYRTGAYDLAVRAFTDLLFNDPTSTSMQGKAHFFLGRCYQILNYPPLAEEQYLLARADPGSALLAQLATARLEEVR
jgi:tetratricopeptide (TPR) repeat protein